MTKYEKEYAKNRVEDLVSRASEHYKEKFTKPGNSPSPEEMLESLLNGDVKPENVTKYGDKLKIEVKGSWPGFEEKVRGEYTDKYEEQMEPIREKAQEIKDDIYLGDSKAALNAIQSLSEMVP
jgi:hypothetical protein